MDQDWEKLMKVFWFNLGHISFKWRCLFILIHSKFLPILWRDMHSTVSVCLKYDFDLKCYSTKQPDIKIKAVWCWIGNKQDGKHRKDVSSGNCIRPQIPVASPAAPSWTGGSLPAASCCSDLHSSSNPWAEPPAAPDPGCFAPLSHTYNVNCWGYLLSTSEQH